MADLNKESRWINQYKKKLNLIEASKLLFLDPSISDLTEKERNRNVEDREKTGRAAQF